MPPFTAAIATVAEITAAEAAAALAAQAAAAEAAAAAAATTTASGIAAIPEVAAAVAPEIAAVAPEAATASQGILGAQPLTPAGETLGQTLTQGEKIANMQAGLNNPGTMTDVSSANSYFNPQPTLTQNLSTPANVLDAADAAQGQTLFNASPLPAAETSSLANPYAAGQEAAVNTTNPYAAGQAGYGQPAVNAPQAPNSFMKGLSDVSDWADKNPWKAGFAGYGLLKATGALDPSSQSFGQESKFNNRYTLSPNFQGSHPNPSQYQYTPRYAADGGLMGFAMGGPADMQNAPTTNFANPSQSMMGTSQYSMATDPMTGNIAQRNMASGGIARYYAGGKPDIYETSQRYAAMLDNRPTAPGGRGDAGIYTDTSPTTRYLNAPDAARARLAQLEKNTYVNTPANFQRPSRQLGRLDFKLPGAKDTAAVSAQDDVSAAQGGIMGYNLGGYASGGNPRLLDGPGDGMSDNIKAVIGDRQPARLADGEFVVPADVVSGLGNGSTKAGAKILHSMMDNVRKARTGTMQQGKQINPRKFVPKT